MSVRRTAIAILASLILVVSGCGRDTKGPEEIPQVPLSMNLKGILSSMVIDMATGSAGFRRVYTEPALEKAQKRAVTIAVENVNWDEVLDFATTEAGVKWDWRRVDEEWIIWVHLSGEKWNPEASGL